MVAMFAPLPCANAGVASLQTTLAQVKPQQVRRRARSVDIASRGTCDAVVLIDSLEGLSGSGFRVAARRTFFSIEIDDDVKDFIDDDLHTEPLDCHSLSDCSEAALPCGSDFLDDVRKDRTASNLSDSTAASGRWSEIDEDGSSDSGSSMVEGSETGNTVPIRPPGNFRTVNRTLNGPPGTFHAVQDYEYMAQSACCTAIPCLRSTDAQGPPGLFFDGSSAYFSEVNYSAVQEWYDAAESCDDEAGAQDACFSTSAPLAVWDPDVH